MGQMPTGNFFINSDGVTVVQHNVDDLRVMADLAHGDHPNHEHAATTTKGGASKQILRSHAYEVKFLGADVPTIIPDKPLDSYNNYFIGDDPSKWASNCKIFQAITYKNIYPKIDVRYYTDNGRLKYDIIVHPGADVSRIAMHYDGADDLKVKNGELIIKTSVGEMKELSPYSYQVVNGSKKEVGARFKVAGNTVRFQLENFDKAQTLVIDPTLIFSTFSGSTADNWGYTATYGPDGSFYGGGIVMGSGFPVSNGAYQTSFGGGVPLDGIQPHDIGIIKFDPNGVTRVYATYIGGSGNEQPHSMVVDGQGNLVIAGRTNSPNYPTTITPTGGGGWDIILTKLNATGSALLGSRKIGGSGSDGVNINPAKGNENSTTTKRNYGDDARSEVILDGAGNVYLASSTQSTNFPVTPGAAQPNSGGANNGRTQDGVVIKTSPDLSTIIFSTYLGGDRDDAAFVLSINPNNNNLYVAGGTASLNFPSATGTGKLYPSYQGGEVDGFISIFSPSGALITSTFVGTSGHDMVFGIQFDRFGFPYVMGTTTVAFPLFNSPFNTQASGKQFISKLKPDLSGYVYSTNFGTGNSTPNISPTAFLVDRCENVYVSGWGGTTNQGYQVSSTTKGLSVTADALQSSTDGSDFYFFVLEKDAVRQLYGSFFGQNGGNTGEHVDGGTSRFDAQGVIYQSLCANCNGGAVFPTSPGVWSRTNKSTNCNLAAVKIAFNFAGVENGVQAAINGVPRDSVGCVPLTVDFTDTIATGQFFLWNFGDGSPDERTTVPKNRHTYNLIGDYRVRLISVDSTTCNISDTAYTTIKVRDDQAFVGFSAAKLPPCASTTYQFTNLSVPSAGKSFTNTSFKWIFGDNSAPLVSGPGTVTHAYAGTGTYRVVLVLTDTNFCNAPDSFAFTIRISPNVKASFETPPSGCAPYNAVINNTSAGGQQFIWDFGDGTTSTDASATFSHLYATPGTYTIRMQAIDSATCNITDSTRFTVIVSGAPTASFTFSPTPPEENEPVTFVNNSMGGVSYKWDFGDGDTLITNSTTTISHIYNATGTFNTCLIVTNQYGCRDTICQPVSAIIVPALDVPSAFTPNNDGVNDRVFVRGFGISRMIWRIYNRWGTLIYQSASQKQGWDGTYKGILQPKEVYTYVLDVEFSDKTTLQKKGDITLL